MAFACYRTFSAQALLRTPVAFRTDTDVYSPGGRVGIFSAKSPVPRPGCRLIAAFYQSSPVGIPVRDDKEVI